MKRANLHEAKTNLSKLVDLASAGEEIIICKANVPVAKIIAFTESKKPRKGGQWKGKVKIADDFDEWPADFMKHFE